jgi:GT2 family glycosyltransferase
MAFECSGQSSEKAFVDPWPSLQSAPPGNRTRRNAGRRPEPMIPINARQPDSHRNFRASVIIAAYTDERWPDIERVVESVQRQTLQPVETLLVVDNNRELAERARVAFPGVTIVEHSGARGASAAHNAGVAVAGGDIVAFIDDDAVADLDWLAHLLAPFTDPKVACTGGSILPAWDGEAPAWFPPEFLWVLGCTYRGLPPTAAAVRNVITANMAIRKPVFDALGGFNVHIGRSGSNALGCEETDLCIRVRQRDPEAQVIYEPAARVWHRVPAQRGNRRYFYTRCFAEGLSKARLSRLVGAGDGLSSERRYVVRALPVGFARGLLDSVRTRRLAGAQRSFAMASGLAAASMGYLSDSLAATLWRRR